MSSYLCVCVPHRSVGYYPWNDTEQVLHDGLGGDGVFIIAILARETALRFGQHVFLGDRKDVEDIVEAIVKVQANAARLS